MGTSSDSRTIRLATPADCSYLTRLMSLHAYRDVGFCPLGALEQRAATGRIWMVEVEGQEAGFVNLTHRRDGLTHVSQVAIDEELWRHGHGTALMNQVERAAREAGSAALTLKCAAGAHANRFWPTIGLVHVADTAGQRRILRAWCKPLQATNPTLTMPPTSRRYANPALLLDPHRSPRFQPESSR